MLGSYTHESTLRAESVGILYPPLYIYITSDPEFSTNTVGLDA